ncbi:MAG: ribose 5-phosphate isomerase B [Myxococcota bacterium]|nr:ribose 5-phosphate isomerase B [Myxococcota bacterium]
MHLAIGSDHAGLELKAELVEYLRSLGHEVEDHGTHDSTSIDYPDYAAKVARSVAKGDSELGFLICGSGQGMCMAANKIRGVRAAVCSDTFSAHAVREHNNANVLCLGQRVVGPGLALEIADTFLKAEFEGGRHARRVGKIMDLEGR